MKWWNHKYGFLWCWSPLPSIKCTWHFGPRKLLKLHNLIGDHFAVYLPVSWSINWLPIIYTASLIPPMTLICIKVKIDFPVAKFEWYTHLMRCEYFSIEWLCTMYAITIFPAEWKIKSHERILRVAGLKCAHQHTKKESPISENVNTLLKLTKQSFLTINSLLEIQWLIPSDRQQYHFFPVVVFVQFILFHFVTCKHEHRESRA